MADSNRSIWTILTKTRGGRVILLLVVLVAAAFLVQAFVGSGAGDEKSAQNNAPDEDGRTGSLILGEDAGFEHSLTPAEKYDTLIHRWGRDLGSAKGRMQQMEKDQKDLRNLLEKERTERKEERKQMVSILQEMHARAGERNHPTQRRKSPGGRDSREHSAFISSRD